MIWHSNLSGMKNKNSANVRFWSKMSRDICICYGFFVVKRLLLILRMIFVSKPKIANKMLITRQMCWKEQFFKLFLRTIFAFKHVVYVARCRALMDYTVRGQSNVYSVFRTIDPPHAPSPQSWAQRR
jgi:hypothetical protein